MYQNTEEILHYIDNEGRDWPLEEMVQAIETLRATKGKMQMTTSTKRTAALRAKRKAAGWTVLHVHLPPDASEVLAEMKQGSDWTTAQIIAELITIHSRQFG